MSTDTEALKVLAERVARHGYEMDSDRRADTATALRQAADDLDALRAWQEAAIVVLERIKLGDMPALDAVRIAASGHRVKALKIEGNE